MNRIRPAYILTGVLFFGSGCADNKFSNYGSNYITPEQAVMAAARTESGISGKFLMTVQATGYDKGNLYLNSEKDYRDQRNLSIEIDQELIKTLEARLHENPSTYYLNKRIEISGTALKVRIAFVVNGEITDKYYFQTHIDLENANSIRVIN
ncbi:hypothetical protein J2D73_02430 [Acetobacter sacchari]|uniref:DUF3568 family protein n=1 Tax=Acetobacter sacchari TaxID=2661687 RepID=A0ABS3LRX7_9PROT|nr:hypothetical protein [Acetobacter sacchari]MBO1358654.1 hypothetical protein [Acetobacter sacchari]